MTTTDRESAADYPPAPGEVQQTSRRIRVEFGGEVIVESTHPLRIIEQNRPPVYYFPMEDVRQEFLVEEEKTST